MQDRFIVCLYRRPVVFFRERIGHRNQCLEVYRQGKRMEEEVKDDLKVLS